MSLKPIQRDRSSYYTKVARSIVKAAILEKRCIECRCDLSEESKRAILSIQECLAFIQEDLEDVLADRQPAHFN